MNRQSWTYIFCISIIIVVWIIVLFFPYIGKHDSINRKISETEKQLLDFKNTIDMLPEIIRKKNQLQQEKYILDSKLYTKAEVLKLFDELRIKAGLKNLTVTEITPPVEELLYLNSFIPDSTQPQFLNIGLNMTGGYVDFGKFVTNLEKEDYFRGINRCIINGNVDTDKDIMMHIGFKALLGRVDG